MRSSGIRTLLAELDRIEGVSVFDPRAAFCDRDTCFAKKDGVYLYNSDGNHLTTAGILTLMGGLRQTTGWSDIVGSALR